MEPFIIAKSHGGVCSGSPQLSFAWVSSEQIKIHAFSTYYIADVLYGKYSTMVGKYSTRLYPVTLRVHIIVCTSLTV